MAIDFYHNPRCATSRKALEMLRKKGVEPHIIEYLKTPPSKSRLKEITKLIGIHPRDLIRKREKEAIRKAGLDKGEPTADQVLSAMVKDPILIERPIIVNGRKARLGRPAEKVLEAL